MNEPSITYHQTDIDAIAKLRETVQRMARESYEKGVEDGLNIEQNDLAKEVKRLRTFMTGLAMVLQDLPFGETETGRKMVEALKSGGVELDSTGKES